MGLGTLAAGAGIAFVQGGGYLIAATTPLPAGLLRQYTNDLRLSWLMMAAATLLLMIMAALQARQRAFSYRTQH